MIGQISDRVSKLKAAVSVQTEIMVDNILGKGIDIHMLGLREMNKEMEKTLDQIFNHESYDEFNHFRLSTSQVTVVKSRYRERIPNHIAIILTYNTQSFDYILHLKTNF